MARIRLGKRERQERKSQYAAVKAAKAQVIADNLVNIKALPTSKGYRKVDWNQGYIFHGASNMARPNMEGANGWGKATPLRPGTGSYRR